MSCGSQKKGVASVSSSLQIENYSEGKLEIKVAPFGLNGNEITVGKVFKDGSIIFNWPEMDLSSMPDSEFYLEPIQRVVGMSFCHEKNIEQANETARAVKVDLALFKKGKYVGSLYPSTKKEIQDNPSLNRHTSLVLGSYLTWYYSDSDANFKATCKVNLEYENSYNFQEVTSYDVQFKKGWNLVIHTLIEKEDWENEASKGSLPKVVKLASSTDIPPTINWYMKYFGE